jgi:hypothetical protein
VPKTQEHARQVPVTEEQFLRQVLTYARARGWRAMHMHDSRRAHFHADSRGFPDLLLLRGERLVFTELKRDKGRTTPEQLAWNLALSEACDEVHIWRPMDWLEIVKVLA